jgi:hypothetical protein
MSMAAAPLILTFGPVHSGRCVTRNYAIKGVSGGCRANIQRRLGRCRLAATVVAIILARQWHYRAHNRRI